MNFNKKNITISVIVLVIIFALTYVIFMPADVSDEPSFEPPEEEDLNDTYSSEYEGVSINQETNQLDSKLLINTHSEQLQELNSYRMILDDTSESTIDIRRNSDYIRLFENIDRINDVEKYSDGNKTYVREGTSLGELNYSNSDTEIDITTQYPEDKIKSIVNNTQVVSLEEQENSLVIELERYDVPELRDIHDIERLYSYRLTIIVSEDGLIEQFNIELSGETEGVDETKNINYDIRDNDEEITEPDWIRKAMDEQEEPEE